MPHHHEGLSSILVACETGPTLLLPVWQLDLLLLRLTLDLLLDALDVVFKLCILFLLLGDLSDQLLDLELDRIQFNEELCVLFGALLDIVRGARLILDGVHF